MSSKSLLSRFRDWQSEFSHKHACWAINHGGWRKMKKLNKRVAKRRMYQFLDKENEDA